MTLRESIQAKINAANEEVANRTAEMQLNDQLYGLWMDEDPVSFKAKFDAFMVQVNKYPVAPALPPIE